MPGHRGFGMDQPHHGWSPIITRPPIRWPNGARVALSVVVALEHLEWEPPAGAVQPPGVYDRPTPEYRAITSREYGVRVGIFRVLEALAACGIPASVAVDALTARRYPWLVRHLIGRGAEIVAHGLSASRTITSRMEEAEERALIAETLETLAAVAGARPRGWFGAHYGESTRTPRLLTEAGIAYLCDWCNDEQPYPMTVPGAELTSLPLLVELDDWFALRERRFPVDGYARLIAEAFDRIYADAGRAQGGRLLAFSIQPWLMGQPFRIGFLEEALAHLTRRKGVWPATAGAVVDWYRRRGG
ncbi:MAG: polysaccharide deacetylase family protein [Proteobacteria bacterium]|nr:polysaccharide deacetylase family protein [Pseudomonadota bacterium]